MSTDEKHIFFKKIFILACFLYSFYHVLQTCLMHTECMNYIIFIVLSLLSETTRKMSKTKSVPVGVPQRVQTRGSLPVS